jgi:transcriptional regulator with XRE-family HTH domain
VPFIVPWRSSPVGLPPDPRQGSVIRQARRSLNLSQVELGLASGLSQAHICRLEHGLRCASGRTAARLGEVLGVAIPLPRILPELTAQGRRDQAERVRERERIRQEVAIAAAVPKLMLGAAMTPPDGWGARN